MTPTDLPSYTAIGALLCFLIALIPSIDIVRKWLQGPPKTEHMPQPFVARLAEEFATRTELKTVSTRIDMLEGKIENGFRRNAEAGERRSAAIYDRLNATGNSLAEMRGEMKGVSEMMHNLQRKLDDITPEIQLQTRQLTKDVGRLEGVVQRGEKMGGN